LVCKPYTKGFSPGGTMWNIILANFLLSEYSGKRWRKIKLPQETNMIKKTAI